MRNMEDAPNQSGHVIPADPRIRRSASSGSVGAEDFTLEDTFGFAEDSAFDMGGLDGGAGFTNPCSRIAGRRAELTLIDGLLPLNFFLHTDIVKLVAGGATVSRMINAAAMPSNGSTKASTLTERSESTPSEGGRWSVTIAGKTVEPMPPCPHLISDYAFRKNLPVDDLLKVFPPFPVALEDEKSNLDDISEDILAEAGESDVFY